MVSLFGQNQKTKKSDEKSYGSQHTHYGKNGGANIGQFALDGGYQKLVVLK